MVVYPVDYTGMAEVTATKKFALLNKMKEK